MAQPCVNRSWKQQRCFDLPNVVQINFEIDNVDSAFIDVVNSNVDVRNIVSTLIWRCTTSRRHINLKPMSKQRWNVCWAYPNFFGSIISCIWTEYRDLSQFGKLKKTSKEETWFIFTLSQVKIFPVYRPSIKWFF